MYIPLEMFFLNGTTSHAMKISLGKAISTHNPMLIKAIMISNGPVLEVGAGIYSTPLLHWLCQILGRNLVTYENVPDFYIFARKFMSSYHRVRYIKNWDEMDLKTHWGVVLIDHDPHSRRIIDLVNLKDKADYIVVHDTDMEDEFHWEKAWPHFKYRYTWKDCRPWTTVVSNFKNLLEFEKKRVPLIK
jgi:hypothetical protein